MKQKIWIILVLLCLSLTSCNEVERQFQNDADLVRLEHLQYWTGLVEEYHEKTGSYPFQEKLSSKSEIGLVKIATKQQRQYLSPGNEKYNPNLDNNANGAFKEFSVKSFVSDLGSALGREIEEKYDIQKVPTKNAIGYYYFISADGYLVWVTCISCGVTEISTLLMDGITPTVNIVSEGMKGQVTKALPRKEMLQHPIFKSWVSSPFQKEVYVRDIVQENSRDSKK